MPKVSNVVWSIDTKHYLDKWTSQERAAVEEFLRAHDIDPTTVTVGDWNEIRASLTGDGTYELDLWVHDLENGRTVPCPTCRGCVKQKHITREVKTAFPMVSGAYAASCFTMPAGGVDLEGEQHG